MPSLQEISELGAAMAERTVAESKAMDYAYLADVRAQVNGGKVGRLNDLIESQYQLALKGLNVNGNT